MVKISEIFPPTFPDPLSLLVFSTRTRSPPPRCPSLTENLASKAPQDLAKVPFWRHLSLCRFRYMGVFGEGGFLVVVVVVVVVVEATGVV